MIRQMVAKMFECVLIFLMVRIVWLQVHCLRLSLGFCYLISKGWVGRDPSWSLRFKEKPPELTGNWAISHGFCRFLTWSGLVKGRLSLSKFFLQSAEGLHPSAERGEEKDDENSQKTGKREESEKDCSRWAAVACSSPNCLSSGIDCPLAILIPIPIWLGQTNYWFRPTMPSSVQLRWAAGSSH